MQIKKAKRQAVPMLISIASPSGYGKTYSALLMASGLVGDNGKVGFIDTEKGRGSMYADDADLLSSLPQGYDVIEVEEPFTPEKYIEAIRAFKDYDVIVIDSGTHEWEGSGGCQDIAENNKLRSLPNWAKAKMEHKKFMNCLTQASQHIIVCLRAREKTKPEKINGKIEMVECGIQPVCEKNFMFEMTLSMMLAENHKPILTKCPKPLKPLFEGEQAIITKALGEKLKAWSEGGELIDKELRGLKESLKSKSMLGYKIYSDFAAKLTEKEKELLKNGVDRSFWSECKYLYEEADAIKEENPNDLADNGFNT